MRNAELVPWCETCDRFYNPNTLQANGSCPTCGKVVGEPGADGAAVGGAPWHFKLLVAATAVYLSYRLIQGIAWVGHHL